MNVFVYVFVSFKYTYLEYLIKEWIYLKVESIFIMSTSNGWM